MIKKSILYLYFCLGISHAAFAITENVDLTVLPPGGISAGETVALNSFTALGTDGTLSFLGFNGVDPAIAGAGSFALFSFDETIAIVTSVSLSGSSNNTSVTARAFDALDNEVDFAASGNNFTAPIAVSFAQGIARLEVRLLESEVTGIELTYSAVPLPASFLLLLPALASLTLRRTARR